jgi:GT2 family glycosyltransferase
MTTEAHDVSVVLLVLNWNNAFDTLSCLAALSQIDMRATTKTIVIDNGSSDDSVARIGEAFPEISLMRTGQNLGYAGGNNAGIGRALEGDTQYICIVNNDVRVTPSFLAELVEVMEADITIGVATPIILGSDNPDVIWTAGAGINQDRGTVVRNMAGESVLALDDSLPFEVAVANGAALLVRKEVFQSVGLFDEEYFLYFEEVDWCIRVRNEGYRIVVAPNSRVTHKVSATLGRFSPTTDYYYNRNHFRFISRNWKGWRRWLLLARLFARQNLALLAFMYKNRGERDWQARRNARFRALIDAARGRWGAGTYRPI